MKTQCKEMDMFESIDKWEAFKIIYNCEWILKPNEKKDNITDDGETALISSMYQQHFGATDYTDHRNDTLARLRSLVWDSLTCRDISYQRIHYYKKDKTPFTKILVWGYLGGYSCKFIN